MAKDNHAFVWTPGNEPPRIEAHSDAKLRLLETYLRHYFDVVCSQPQIDTLRIALVDAFSGGGQFQRDGKTRFGSPLVMIDAVRTAEAMINSRRTKPLKIEAKFFFVDENPNAIEYLKISLRENGMLGPNVIIECASASDSLPRIVKQIRGWSRAGRSIFFLDQCGYSDVPHEIVRMIYKSLRRSEIIVTYNFGAIYDYMHDKAKFLSALAPLELTQDHLRALLKEKERQAGRFFAGRLLGMHLKTDVGSRYASRFFLHSKAANRDMWFVHYSKIPRSRLEMSAAHWEIKNASITQGDAGLDMLGFRPDWENQICLDFGFEESDEGRMTGALMGDIPRRLEQYSVNTAPTVGEFLSMEADNMAATENQFREALKSLESEREIEILTPSGARKRPASHIRLGHRIMLSRQGKLF